MFKKLQHVCGCIDEHLARPLGLKLQDMLHSRESGQCDDPIELDLFEILSV